MIIFKLKYIITIILCKSQSAILEKHRVKRMLEKEKE